jgi:hypothetical protein
MSSLELALATPALLGDADTEVWTWDWSISSIPYHKVLHRHPTGRHIIVRYEACVLDGKYYEPMWWLGVILGGDFFEQEDVRENIFRVQWCNGTITEMFLPRSMYRKSKADKRVGSWAFVDETKQVQEEWRPVG